MHMNIYWSKILKFLSALYKHGQFFFDQGITVHNNSNLRGGLCATRLKGEEFFNTTNEHPQLTKIF